MWLVILNLGPLKTKGASSEAEMKSKRSSRNLLNQFVESDTIRDGDILGVTLNYFIFVRRRIYKAYKHSVLQGLYKLIGGPERELEPRPVREQAIKIVLSRPILVGLVSLVSFVLIISLLLVPFCKSCKSYQPTTMSTHKSNFGTLCSLTRCSSEIYLCVKYQRLSFYTKKRTIYMEHDSRPALPIT